MTLILSGTNGVSDIDGDASTPAIRGTDANTGIFFGTDVIGFSEGGTECARFNSSGNLQTIGTISVGNATPSTSGAGITFPATQSASSNANTLDDYEEGTWTPTLRGAATAGTTTYAVQRGGYIKVGSMVTVFCDLGVNSATGTGSITIGGLPFTSINDLNFNGSGSLMVESLNWGGGTYMQIYKNANTTDCFLYYMTDDAGWVSQQMVNEAQNYIFTLTYRAAS